MKMIRCCYTSYGETDMTLTKPNLTYYYSDEPESIVTFRT